MRRSGAHLMRHDHPKRSALLGRRAHRQAQPHALVAHHQARPIAHASETLGNKSSDILLERRVTHSRDHNATALVDCQRRCSGCGQCLDQNLQLDIAVHGSPRLQPQPLSVAWHLKCFKIERYCSPNTIGQKPPSCEYMNCPASPSWRGDKSSSGPINLRTSHTRKSSYRSTVRMRSPARNTQISYFSTRFPARAAFPNSCMQCQSSSKSPMRWACRPF